MPELYSKWPIEIELGNDYMLQYNLYTVNITPFRIIEWVSSAGEYELWKADTEIGVIYEGEIWWDGVRHSQFCPADAGYCFRPNFHAIASGLLLIDKLCKELCDESNLY